jgi:hypothetical protein
VIRPWRLPAALAVVAAGLEAGTGPASAGPYLGHAPTGVVAADNVLQRPAGKPKGAVMLIHGGSLVLVGRRYLLTSEAAGWRRLGYITYDVDYRAGLDSLADVVAAYDYLRTRIDVPICVTGDSSGGSLALLLVVERPSVRCVWTEGAIADELTMPASFEQMERTWALPGHMRAFSPVQYGRRIDVPVLMGGAVDDPIVPERAQMTEMHAADPTVRTMLLAAGAPAAHDDFTHANVTHAALMRYSRAARRTVYRSTRPPASAAATPPGA